MVTGRAGDLADSAVRPVCGEPAVVAAAGGVLNEPRTWRMLLDKTTVVWLRASPEDHWSRVVAQGDRRPMADHPAAMQELRAILGEREPVYGQAAIKVDTSWRVPEEIVADVEKQLTQIQQGVTDAPPMR